MRRFSVRGYISISVLFFFASIVIVLGTILEYHLANARLVTGWDHHRQRREERQVLANFVKQGILSLKEVSPTTQSGSLTAKVDSLVAGWLGASRVGMVTRTTSLWTRNAAVWPSGPVGFTDGIFSPYGLSYPATTRPSATGVFSASSVHPGPVTEPGLGRKAGWWLQTGPYASLGTVDIGFDRVDPKDGSLSKYLVKSYLTAIPMTNINFVVYGLPSTGANYISGGQTKFPKAAPTWLGYSWPVGVTPFVMSSLQHTDDPTVVRQYDSSLNVPGTLTERMSYQYLDNISFGWNFYEYVVGDQRAGVSYQAILLDRAMGYNDGNEGVNQVFDFSQGDFNSSPGSVGTGIPIGGMGGLCPFFSHNGAVATQTTSAVRPTQVTLDLRSIPDRTSGELGQTVAIVDSLGGSQVTILGHVADAGDPANSTIKSPVVILIRNPNPGSARTEVVFEGKNDRPVLVYLQRCNVTFGGPPVGYATQDWVGGMVVDPNSTIGGNVASGWPSSTRWFGHLSFFHTFPLTTVFPSGPPIYAWPISGIFTGATASIGVVSPRFLLVSARTLLPTS